ncbi:MAG: glycosyltransferase family 39 protein [Cyanobacteriota bacterium]|nr:glycosyltransferase family 39 protein [Cyanobacteriota bacterium]
MPGATLQGACSAALQNLHPPRPISQRQLHLLWWVSLAGLWALGTAADRLWLALDQRLPSWDQADYLNSAVDHGRALGLLSPGQWQGWQALLDLSPKIPPLASLVNGAVMAIAGDTPDQASWALAIWQALMMVVVALWGRELLGRGFGLLCAALLLLTPGLIHLRVDYTLDLPLAATGTLALWLLGRWQAEAPKGGRWGQMLAAATAMAAALLVKQSALLLLTGPLLWAIGTSMGRHQRQRRWQVLVGGAVVLALLLPWLHHNWITTLGGTNRAVLESAAAEGDPPVWSWLSFTWYLKRLPAQLGLVLLPTLPVAASLMARGWPMAKRLPAGWGWLLLCALGGWLFTTLSPNKDARYITPVLPVVVILLARAWWEVGLWLKRKAGPSLAWALLLAGVTGTAAQAASVAAGQIQRSAPAPVAKVTARLRSLVGDAPTTLLVVPGNPEINEQTVTTFGRLGGGRIEGRRLGRARHEHPLVLERSEWILLATGDQGTNRPFSRELSHRVRADGRFQRVDAWPWSKDRQVELWQRRPGPQAEPFDAPFIQLARGMERGPSGLGPLFARIGPEHQLDAHFLYQDRVRRWAQQRLQHQPQDPDALWSLALIATLRNRPQEAAQWYGLLQRENPSNPWPVAYQAVVLLANWQPVKAHAVLSASPAPVRREPALEALEDLSGVVSGRLNRLAALRKSLPKAIASIKGQLKSENTNSKRKPPE